MPIAPSCRGRLLGYNGRLSPKRGESGLRRENITCGRSEQGLTQSLAKESNYSQQLFLLTASGSPPADALRGFVLRVLNQGTRECAGGGGKDLISALSSAILRSRNPRVSPKVVSYLPVALFQLSQNHIRRQIVPRLLGAQALSCHLSTCQDVTATGQPTVPLDRRSRVTCSMFKGWRLFLGQ